MFGNGGILGNNSGLYPTYNTGLVDLMDVHNRKLSGDSFYDNVTLLMHGRSVTNNKDSRSFTALSGQVTVNTSIFKVGQSSLYFNGSSSLSSQQPYGVFTGDFTIECWFLTTTSGTAGRGIMNTGNPASSTNWQLSVEGTDYVTFYYNSATTITSLAPILTNTWYHVAVTRSGSTIRLFLDGVLQSSVTYATSYSDSSIFKIGAARPGTTYFTGYIDELRITAGVARYTSGFTPSKISFPNF